MRVWRAFWRRTTTVVVASNLLFGVEKCVRSVLLRDGLPLAVDVILLFLRSALYVCCDLAMVAHGKREPAARFERLLKSLRLPRKGAYPTL